MFMLDSVYILLPSACYANVIQVFLFMDYHETICLENFNSNPNFPIN